MAATGVEIANVSNISTPLWIPRKQDNVEEPKKSSKEGAGNSKTRISKPKFLSNKQRTLKFARPIKILVIESKSEYCKTVWCTIGIGFAHVMMGAINMTVLMYSLYSGDIHACLCCLAYHFFSAEAILSFNYANGWSTPMRQRHKRFVHVFLQLCGMVCALVGTTEVLLKKGLSESVHGISGTITTVLAVLSLLSGPCGIFGRNYLKLIHVSCGIPTFLMSSISLCAGFFTVPFKGWADLLIIYILTGFIIFYSIFMIITCVIKFIIRI